MAITYTQTREEAIEVINALFDLYEVDIPDDPFEESSLDEEDEEEEDEDEEDDEEDEGKEGQYVKLVSYAEKGFLRLSEDKDVVWDPINRKTKEPYFPGGLTFQECTGDELSALYTVEVKKGKKAKLVKQDAGFYRLMKGLLLKKDGKTYVRERELRILSRSHAAAMITIGTLFA